MGAPRKPASGRLNGGYFILEFQYSQNCIKVNSAHLCESLRCCDGEEGRYWPEFWADRTVSTLSPFSPSTPWKTASHFILHKIEESLSQLRATHRVSQLAGMFLGLGLILRSYCLRELLACWLFFSLVFVLLALIVFGSVLAFCAGRRVAHWARTATQATPIVDFGPGELRVKTILDDSK